MILTQTNVYSPAPQILTRASNLDYSAAFYIFFLHLHLQQEPMGSRLKATDRKSESTEGKSNTLLVLFFSGSLLKKTSRQAERISFSFPLCVCVWEEEGRRYEPADSWRERQLRLSGCCCTSGPERVKLSCPPAQWKQIHKQNNTTGTEVMKYDKEEQHNYFFI